jgi:hypothetical protein
MKHKLYKPIFTLIAICFLGTTFAQKFDKKFTENFKVNNDVEIIIDASNTEINVSTWNKNEVKVEAFIEIEGLSKEEAEKYFKNWNFEALVNKRKVKLTSQGINSLGLRNDFIIFNDSDFNFPDIELPDFEAIVIPEMNFDFDFDFDGMHILEDLENLDEIVGKDGEYSFEWNDGEDKISIKSKKEWEAFKKSKKYKELKEKMSVAKIKMRKNLIESKKSLKEIKIKEMKEGLAKARLEIKKIDKEKIKKEFAEAKKHIMEMKLDFNSSSNDLTINGKKIKIKKRLEIKVPKNATFNLNTRHCKVKLPNTKAFGKVSYGGFDASNLNGGRLTIDYSKVSINDLNGCTLFLNNVTDANIASVTNTTLSNNSSGLNINIINENVNLSDKFGELTIHNFNPNFNNFVLNLSNSDASILLGDVKTSFIYNINTSKLDNKTSFGAINKVIKTNEISTTSNISNENTKNKFELNAEYSTIIIK